MYHRVGSFRRHEDRPAQIRDDQPAGTHGYSLDVGLRTGLHEADPVATADRSHPSRIGRKAHLPKTLDVPGRPVHQCTGKAERRRHRGKHRAPALHVEPPTEIDEHDRLGGDAQRLDQLRQRATFARPGEHGNWPYRAADRRTAGPDRPHAPGSSRRHSKVVAGVRDIAAGQPGQRTLLLHAPAFPVVELPARAEGLRKPARLIHARFSRSAVQPASPTRTA